MRKFIVLFLLIFTAPVFSQSILIPIVETKVGGLLGGVRNGKFIDAKQTFSLVASENKSSFFKVYSLNEPPKTISANLELPEVPCEDFYELTVKDDATNGAGLGSGANWNAMPRAMSRMDLNNASYKKIIAEVLKSKGVTTKNARITQAFRIDLEGDGAEEVLLTATSYAGNIQPTAKKNDYSFVLLRKAVNGKAKNIVVTGDFVKKNITFGAPGKFEISSILDLNGDGKMEVVIYGAYYEGHWIEVYESKGSNMVNVKELNASCGV